MNRRKRFEQVMNHQQPDGLLVDLGGCPLSSMEGNSDKKLMEALGITPEKDDRVYRFGDVRQLDERMLKALDIDTRSVGDLLHPPESHFRQISDTEYIDEWGIHFRFTGLYWEIVESPLQDATLEELQQYRFPDPDSIDPRLIQSYVDRARYLYEETDYVVCANHPVYGVFELGCWMCGFEDFLYRMLAEPEFVHCFFTRVLDYQLRVIDMYYKALGPYIHYTSSGDDFATQTTTFISPKLFRELVKPYFKERIRVTKQLTQAKFLHHSCGSVYSLIDDLVDCGVEILNPIQPKAANMEPWRLKKSFGDRIVFHGGIDTQELLPFASREQVEQVVSETIETMNKDGGYIFAAAHNIQPDVNVENLMTMFETARKYK